MVRFLLRVLVIVFAMCSLSAVYWAALYPIHPSRSYVQAKLKAAQNPTPANREALQEIEKADQQNWRTIKFEYWATAAVLVLLTVVLFKAQIRLRTSDQNEKVR